MREIVFAYSHSLTVPFAVLLLSLAAKLEEKSHNFILFDAVREEKGNTWIGRNDIFEK